MALSPGTRLGPFEILEPVGAAGMGEVCRVDGMSDSEEDHDEEADRTLRFDGPGTVAVRRCTPGHRPGDAEAAPSEPEREKTGGRSKKLLVLLGLGAGAGAVVALTGGELGPGVFESQDTPMWISIFGLVSSRITVPGMDGTISSVTVDVEVTHTYIDDLDVTLRHPDGTQARLHDRTGGSSDDRDATFRPTEFDGKTPNGVWTLYAEGGGRLKSWRLTLAVAEWPARVSGVEARGPGGWPTWAG